MAEFPHLPLFTDAYIADTMHLDCTESGAYLHLLMAAWRSVDCSLPDDDKKLCRMARCTPRQWSKMRATILDFFTLENHKWTQKRLLKERVYVTAKSDQASRAGKASALKRKETRSTDVAPTLQRKANGTPTPIPIPIPTPNLEVEESIPVGAKSPDLDLDKLLFDVGKELLGSKAGGVIVKLKKAKGGVGGALDVLEAAKGRNNPMEYVQAAIRTKKAKPKPDYSCLFDENGELKDD